GAGRASPAPDGAPPVPVWKRVLHFIWPRHKDAAPPGTPRHAQSTREVVETIVFVVVLVLLLKSFAAEAFVIPTGSMAETLYGYQANVKCPKCKFDFPVNYSGVVDPQDGHPRLVDYCTCPNCHEMILQLSRPPGPHKEELARQVSEARTGDRV